MTSGVTIVIPASGTWTPAPATYQQAYSSTITLGGTGTTVSTVSGLPAGLSWTADGTISGTPGAVGDFPVTVTITGDSGTATTTATLEVRAVAPGSFAWITTGGDVTAPGTLRVAWGAPSSNGAPGALEYTVRYRLEPSGEWTSLAPTTATTATLSSLPVGGLYLVEITATNSAGLTGSAVQSPGLVWVASTVSALTATPADGSATLSWTTSSGGFPVEKYVISQSDGRPVTTHDLPAGTSGTTLTGLTNGATYSVTVAACTVFLPGHPCTLGTAATVTVVPSAAPGAPTIGTATPGDGRVTVTWQAPASDSHTLVATRAGVAPVGTAVGVVVPQVPAAASPGTVSAASTPTRAAILAATGTDARSVALAALALTLAGSCALVVARARRTRHRS